jgi:hypothetical protein
MPIKKDLRTVSIIIVGCAAIFAALFFSISTILKKEAAAGRRKEVTVVWKEEFAPASGAGETALPKGWVLKSKPGTKPAVFLVGTDAENKVSFLHMEADDASASLITKVGGVDLKKTPFLRWRWRAKTLPEGADGRRKARDDQAIGIYVGAGSALNNKSISYRWDTDTPKGAEGNCAYGLGFVKVKWYTLRNKEDAADGRWFIEERNVAEDFKKAWGFFPTEVYVSVSCNSQYTDSRAAADLEWIEFVSHSAG